MMCHTSGSLCQFYIPIEDSFFFSRQAIFSYSLKMSFRSEIANETERLTSLCGQWEAKFEDEAIPEESMS